jgi:hypothetical protein
MHVAVLLAPVRRRRETRRQSESDRERANNVYTESPSKKNIEKINCRRPGGKCGQYTYWCVYYTVLAERTRALDCICAVIGSSCRQ